MNIPREIRDFADIASKGMKVPPIYLFLDYVLPGFIFVYCHYREFNILYFILLTISIAPLMASTNLFDDYFDYLNGYDPQGSSTTLYRRHPFEFYKKSKVEVLFFALFTLAIYFLFFLYLTILAGPLMIVFAIAGALLGYSYTGYPIGYKYRGLGLVGAVISTISIPQIVYYMYFKSVSPYPSIFSVPYSILIAMALYVSDYRDRNLDRSLGVRTLPVILNNFSRTFFHLLFLLFYSMLAIFVFLKIYPITVMLLFLFIPISHFISNKVDRMDVKDMDFIVDNLIFVILTSLSVLLLF